MGKSAWLAFCLMWALVAEADRALFPEDGSQPIELWYFNAKFLPHEIPATRQAEFFAAFARHGIELRDTQHFYRWTQDLLFFDQRGRMLIQKKPGNNLEFFKGLSTGVLEEEGSWFRFIHMNGDGWPHADVEQRKLRYALLEGGSTISGRNSKGQDYVILTQHRFEGMKAYLRSLYPLDSERQLKKRLALDLAILPQNLYVLPSEAGSGHIDVYMKAMPGGVLLLDDPATNLAKLQSWYKETGDQALRGYIEYYQNTNNDHESQRLIAARNYLEKYFEVIPLNARFRRIQRAGGNQFVTTDVNFFNSLSGTDPEGRAFFITNAAESSPVFIEKLRVFLHDRFGILPDNVHAIGRAGDGSGINCFGSPSVRPPRGEVVD